MAYATARPGGAWELRESLSTPTGPRSRTLTTFRTLSDEAIAHARSRATKPLSAEEVREAARRAGAPVELAAADRAAASLLSELAAGREPHPILRGLLIDALQARPPRRLGEARSPDDPGRRDANADDVPMESLDNVRAAAAWLPATPDERGKALYDLLLLADRFPRRRPRERERFPRLDRAA